MGSYSTDPESASPRSHPKGENVGYAVTTVIGFLLISLIYWAVALWVAVAAIFGDCPFADEEPRVRRCLLEDWNIPALLIGEVVLFVLLQAAYLLVRRRLREPERQGQ